MKKIKNLMFAIILSISSPLMATHVDVFTHPDIDVVELDANTLRAIFTLDIQYWWKDGKRIYVAIFPDITWKHKEFLWEFLGISSSIRYREIIDLKYSIGRASAPKVVNSDFEMFDYLSATDGSIGYLNGEFFINEEGGDDEIKKIKIIF